MQNNKQSQILALLFLFICAAMIFVATPFIGPKVLTFSDVWGPQAQDMDGRIFWHIRVPRVLVGFMAGAIFALCGMVFQALFRNPLVSPFTLGVSAGSSFGASVYIWLGFGFSILGISGITFFAFLGALLAIFIVWSLAKVKYGSSIAKMLLAGVAVSFF